MTLLEKHLAVAHAAADAAALISYPYFQRRQPKQWDKEDGSLVTEADVNCEAEIRRILSTMVPEDAILGEENGTEGASNNRWIIDPIDGTENFSRGVPIWGSLIARMAGNYVEVAVIDAPALGMRWWASAGGGAFSNRIGRLAVSTKDQVSRANLCYGGFHEWLPPYDKEKLSRVVEDFHCAWGWGNFWGHMLVAEGAVDAAISIGTSIWDVAAPSLIVAEAGGRWSDALGFSSLTNRSLVTSNSILHSMVTDRLNKDI